MESCSSTSRLLSSPVSSLTRSTLKSKDSSPRTVLNDLENVSRTTEGDGSSFGDLTIRSTPPEFKGTGHSGKKQMSPCKFLWTLLSSSLRRRISKGEIYQPPLRCFSHEEILIATNDFDPGEKTIIMPCILMKLYCDPPTIDYFHFLSQQIWWDKVGTQRCTGETSGMGRL